MTDQSGPSKNNTGGKYDQGGLTFLLLSIFFAVFFSLLLFVVSSPQLKKLTRFERTLMTTLSEYADELDGAGLYERTSREIYGLLDRYSGYAPRERFEQVAEEFSGSYAGIGVTIISRPNGLLVTSVNENGPSQPAGLLPGDVIIKADSLSLVGRTTRQASLTLRGKSGEHVAVTLLRPVGSAHLAIIDSISSASALPFDTLTFDIKRGTVPLRHVNFAGITKNNALYIKLEDFGSGAMDQFERVFDSLRETQPDYRGVLIDLRGNPGGLLSEALELTDFFLEEDILILGKKGRSRWSRHEAFSSGDDQSDGAPLLILVDRQSASASEILAGSLKFASRARLVGDTTFGKGLVQEYNRFADGSASRLSTARYYFAGERYLNQPDAEKVDSGSGIAPDYFYQFSDGNRFVRQLGAQLLFIPFAARYQEWIISSFESGGYRDVIVEFENFAGLSGFTYESAVMTRARNLHLVSSMGGLDRESMRVTSEILRQAEVVEKNMFSLEGERIIRRLARLAYQRRDGDRASFVAVGLHDDPDIEYCERLLLDSLAAGR